MFLNQVRFALNVSAVFLLSVLAIWAQTNRGGITGNVTDQSGAVVPNASVTIKNVGTNEVRKLTTNNKGSFIQENLEPVVYTVTIEAPGFTKAVLEKVKVDTATVATANVVLQAGSINTEVNVSADVQQLNTESGTLTQTISGRELNDLPLANRSVLDLAVTIPNVSGDVGTEDPQISGGPPLPGYNLNTNGGRSGSTNMLADGISNTGVGLARESVAFSPETVQEFTVQTNGFDAQYGKSGGGIISVTTKSGSNDFNGLALWYLRNPLFNADPYTQASVNRPVENLRWNQFNGQLGGPVIIPKIYNGRNKTFFFFAGEPRYQTDHLQAVAAVPTDAMRSGDFSNLVGLNGSSSGGFGPASLKSQFPAGAFNTNLPNIYNQFTQVGNQYTVTPLATGATYPQFPGNVIPASLQDPVSVKLLQYLPRSNTNWFLDSNGYLDNYSTYRFVQDNATRYNTRIDQNFGDRNHVSFRWSTVPEIGITGVDPAYPIDGGGATYSDSHQYLLSDTFTISPTVVNEIRLAYTRANFSGTLPPQYDINTGQNISAQNGLPTLTKGGIPLLSFELNGFAQIGSQGSTLNNNLEQQYEIADNVYVTRGAMTWKFGVDLSRALLNTESFYAADGGNYSFRYLQTDANGGSTGGQPALGGIAFASYLLGVPNAVTLSNSLIPYYYRWSAGAAFVQNDWKVKPNLTLNLGLRYSLQLPRIEEYNHQGFFDPSKAITVPLPAPCPLPTCVANTSGLPTLTQATIIPFAFDGYGGRSRYITPIKWLDFEPRVGFAWTPDLFGSHAWVIRGGYGISHSPLTGQNRGPIPSFASGSPNYGETAGQTITTPLPQTGTVPVTRLSSNPPYDPFVPINNLLGLTNNPSGLVYQNAINFPAYVTTNENSVPYVQNWTVSIQRQLATRTLLELSYVGSKGTHLFLPATNLNNPPLSYLAALQNDNYLASSTVADPLGRTNPNGVLIRDTYASLAAPYLGFGTVATYADASGNSTFNAGIVSIRHQSEHGFTGYANFRWSKSIDDASDASPDKGALTTGSVGGGQVSYGAPASGDKSLSTYNIPYDFNFVAIYDLPYGKGRMFGGHSWYPLQFLFGGWTLSGVERFFSGYPITPTISSDSYINTTLTHEIRPDIVPGVPVVNPLWSRNCPSTAVCQQYINVAAFELPPAGQLGNAPRTIGNALGPMIQALDLSVQKTWNIGEKRRIQLRVDAINAFNHPVFRNSPNNGSGSLTDILNGYPPFTFTAANITSIYSTWAAANGQPAANTAGGAANIATISQFIGGAANAGGILAANFYTVPLPTGFALSNQTSYNVLTPNGFKLYEIRGNINSGSGALSQNQFLNPPRYVQFGLKIYF